jgi:hypothetical protein
MKNEEIMNEVVQEENTTNEVPNENMTRIEEDSFNKRVEEGCIPLVSCTGIRFIVDPLDPANDHLFGPENRMQVISSFTRQEESLNNICRNLMFCGSDKVSAEEFKEYVENETENLKRSLAGFGVDTTIYKELNPNLSTYELAMFMTYDLMSFTKTLNHYLTIMMIGSSWLGGAPGEETSFMPEDVFEPGEVEIPSDDTTKGKYDNNKCYKVLGHIQPNNSVAIIDITEGDTSPDNMLIVHSEEDADFDGVVSVYTIAPDEKTAVNDARVVFEGYIRDMLETDADKAYRVAEEMTASSGLLG